jgi:hypothetical protein
MASAGAVSPATAAKTSPGETRRAVIIGGLSDAPVGRRGGG